MYLQQRQSLRATIQRDKAKGILTPETVAAYAVLNISDDDGLPITPAAHHWLWLRLLCDERIKKLLIIAPPESAKTTWTISAYLGCRLGFWPEQSVIIGSTSGPVAEKRSMTLRTAVESTEWQNTFPGILPVRVSDGFKWTTTEWSLAQDGKPRAGRLHPTVAAYGTNGPVIGSRSDVFVADDLLDFENSRTAHQRGLVETWLHTSMLSRRKAQIGRIIMIGTAWHFDDIYSKAKREGGWVVCHVPLLSEADQVFATISYPDNWKYETLGEPIGNAETLEAAT